MREVPRRLQILSIAIEARYIGAMRKWRVVLAIVLLAVCARAGDKKKPKLETLPDAVAEIENPNYAAAAAACPTAGWAATMQSMLAPQGVQLTQEYWQFKVYGGTRCLGIGDLETLANQVTGDYRDDTGKQFHIEFTYQQGAPRIMDDIIASLKSGRELALIWSGHPYLLRGVLYGESLTQAGTHYFTVKELRLLDPYVAEGDGHEVVFKNPEDDPNTIDGTYQVTAKEIQGSDWLRERTK
jgi:hypothetical protein